MSVLAPGDVVGGSLRIDREIGRGAMGIVFEATDTSLRRKVAVKVLHEHAVHDPLVRARFAREARSLAKLAHDSVVRVFAVGELDDGTPYVVMELLTGRSFEAMLGKDPIPVTDVLDWAKQALEALAAAHAAGIIHRDIKPANLFLADQRNRSPRVKVLDFGIAKELARADHLTATGEAVGSPAYMSPEQIAGKKELDARSDVWSFGVTLYELLTGELPFRAQNLAAMLSKILNASPPPLRSKRPSIPIGVEVIVLRCLEKDPDRRYSSAVDLLGDVELLRTDARGPKNSLVFLVALSAVLLAAIAGFLAYEYLGKH